MESIGAGYINLKDTVWKKKTMSSVKLDFQDKKYAICNYRVLMKTCQVKLFMSRI